MLPGPGLAVPGAHLRSAHRLSRRQQHPAAAPTGRQSERKPRKRLSDACRAYGIEGWENIDKPAIAKAIGEGRWREYGQEAVFDYCEEDVRMSVQLLRAQLRSHRDQRGRTLLPAADVARVLWWSNYSAKAIALIQARGMPIDVPLWNLVQENMPAVIGELLRQFDPSHGSDDPIYTPDGRWSYTRFERWLVHSGVPDWPRLGQRQTRHLGRRLPPDEPHPRHRGSAHAARQHRLHRQGAAADRARRPQPAEPVPVRHGDRPQRAYQEPLQRPCRRAWLHGVSPDTIGAYLDWRSQEVGVAAAASNDAGVKGRL